MWGVLSLCLELGWPGVLRRLAADIGAKRKLKLTEQWTENRLGSVPLGDEVVRWKELYELQSFRKLIEVNPDFGAGRKLTSHPC
ncbi:hypothetical protein PanWU01x14_312370 [Parasponia andersonii]|uniref:Uncharacterized protein n=1 Tax=Parasponia andersonii TaxID=3476 RepID=A0A2P5APS3_PARAD|nr:hypothetical protein PanWU01x14_312370 [Parasponia andersonii]